MCYSRLGQSGEAQSGLDVMRPTGVAGSRGRAPACWGALMGGTLSQQSLPGWPAQGGTLLSFVLTSGMSELFPITPLDRVACISMCYMGS